MGNLGVSFFSFPSPLPSLLISSSLFFPALICLCLLSLSHLSIIHPIHTGARCNSVRGQCNGQELQAQQAGEAGHTQNLAWWAGRAGRDRHGMGCLPRQGQAGGTLPPSFWRMPSISSSYISYNMLMLIYMYISLYLLSLYRCSCEPSTIRLEVGGPLQRLYGRSGPSLLCSAHACVPSLPTSLAEPPPCMPFPPPFFIYLLCLLCSCLLWETSWRKEGGLCVRHCEPSHPNLLYPRREEEGLDG